MMAARRIAARPLYWLAGALGFLALVMSLLAEGLEGGRRT